MRKFILATVFGVLGLGGFSAAASACERGGQVTYQYQVQPRYGRFEGERFGWRGRDGERERFERRGRFERERFEHGRFGRER